MVQTDSVLVRLRENREEVWREAYSWANVVMLGHRDGIVPILRWMSRSSFRRFFSPSITAANALTFLILFGLGLYLQTKLFISPIQTIAAQEWLLTAMNVIWPIAGVSGLAVWAFSFTTKTQTRKFMQAFGVVLRRLSITLLSIYILASVVPKILNNIFGVEFVPDPEVTLFRVVTLLDAA